MLGMEVGNELGDVLVAIVGLELLVGDIVGMVRELLKINSGSSRDMESKLRKLGHTSSISLLLSIPSHLAIA